MSVTATNQCDTMLSVISKILIICLLLLVSIMLLGEFPVISLADSVPVRLSTVNGIALTPSGKPLSDATLFFNPDRMAKDADANRLSVPTDLHGCFTWHTPPDEAVSVGDPVSCAGMLEERNAWHLFLLSMNPSDSQGFAHCTTSLATHWKGQGAQATLVVDAPEPGNLSCLVLGPDGVPLCNRDVQLNPGLQQSDTYGFSVYSGRTDSTGRLSIRLAPEDAQLQIAVPGVGFGASGTVEVVANKTMNVDIPRLAPFSTVSGVVSPELVKSREHVALDYRLTRSAWEQRSATIDARDHFTLTDVWPGKIHLIIPELIPASTWASGVFSYRESDIINIGQGDHPSGIKVTVADGFVTGATKSHAVADKTDEGASVIGTVTDSDGTPITGAIVYALCSFQGPLRAYQKVLMDSTDANGIYAISNLPRDVSEDFGTSVSLVASKPGFALATASAESMPDKTPESKNPRGDLRIRLILPRKSASLAVRVVQDNHPVANATVQLTPHFGTALFDDGYMGTIPGDARDAVDKVIKPVSTTGSDGIVEFDNLTPGLWDISTFTTLDRQSGEADMQSLNHSFGVPVHGGQTDRYLLRLSNWKNTIPIRLITNKVITNRTTLFTVQSVGDWWHARGGRSIGYDHAYADGDGIGRLDVVWPGLLRVTAHIHDSPVSGTETEPYDEASIVIAYAPEIQKPSQIVLSPTTLSPTHKGPGKIHVTLLDVQGKPVAGTVTLDGSMDSVGTLGTTDNQGDILFQDLPSGEHSLTASIPGGAQLPVLNNASDQIPEDSILVGHAIFAPQTVTVQPDEENHVVFRLQPVGYVKGRVTFPRGDTLDKCQISGPWFWYSGTTPQTQLLKSGEFVSGPYLKGKSDFFVRRTVDSQTGASVDGPSVSVVVSSRQVSSLTLVTKPPSKSQIKAALSEATVKPLIGVILLPDGTTPAWAARTVLFMPDQWKPTQAAMANALGQLNDYNFTSDDEAPDNPPPGSPTTPVVVAYLPGSNGAVIAPYTPGKPVRLTLPPAVSLHGRVTVGGQSVMVLDSTFEVRAAYQGKGKLNDLLSVEATAQADGTFDLDGLTPGVYRVQAARDGIWLSQTQTVTVGQSPLPDPTFDIGVPGAAMLLHFRDAAGNPLISRTVALMRPDGPLADALWPKTLTTDGAGDLRLEGLEAGPQAISVTSPECRGGKQDRMVSFAVPKYALGKQVVDKTVHLTTNTR